MLGLVFKGLQHCSGSRVEATLLEGSPRGSSPLPIGFTLLLALQVPAFPALDLLWVPSPWQT